jgi:hypothetical protein
MLLRPRRSLVPVAQEQGLQEQRAVGFRTADTDDHGNDTGLKADLQVSGTPDVVVFHAMGSKQTPCTLWTITGLHFTSARLNLRKVQFSTPTSFMYGGDKSNGDGARTGCSIATAAVQGGHRLRYRR